ncbi:ATP-binding protein [Jatrophihabitans sp. YIM 134969]
MRDTTEPDGTELPDDPVTAGPSAATRPGAVLTGTARLHPDRGAARRARALMAEWLTSWWGPAAGDSAARSQLRDRLAVVLSELVSNAVVHGERAPASSPQLEVELHEFDGVVRLVVADRSRRPGEAAFRPPASPRLPSTASESGRGLFIVDQLADIWQAEPTSDGLVVWCDFSLDGRELPPSGRPTHQG